MRLASFTAGPDEAQTRLRGYRQPVGHHCRTEERRRSSDEGRLFHQEGLNTVNRYELDVRLLCCIS